MVCGLELKLFAPPSKPHARHSAPAFRTCTAVPNPYSLTPSNLSVKLTVLSNGSLRVEGEDIELVDAQGQPYGLGGRQRLSICSCGLSKQKPFCDGSHKGHFEHAAVAFDLPAPKVS